MNTLNHSAIEIAAAQLRTAHEQSKPCPPVRHHLPDRDLASAYAVQQHNTDYWVAKGRRLVGCKAGLTSKSVQTQLGVDQPDFGRLFADMAVADGEALPSNAVLQTKVEAEVALVLAHDLDMELPTNADLLRATAYALPAIEIVGSRIADWDINIVDTIADNASSGLFVLGNEPRKLEGLDLLRCGMVMELGGNVVSSGAGVACLGHPLNAATWLARTLGSNGAPLRAGDIVLTGALGPMVSVAPGERIEIRINGLGSVHTGFLADSSL